MAKRKVDVDMAVRIAVEGLQETVRVELVDRYVLSGGSFSSPDVCKMREALKGLRRQYETSGPRAAATADALTAREDAVEMMVVDAELNRDAAPLGPWSARVLGRKWADWRHV